MAERLLNERQNQLHQQLEKTKENEQKIHRWEEEITRLETELLKQVNANEMTTHSVS